MNTYIRPQAGFSDGFIGFGFTCYWGNNPEARYITFTITFINLTASLNIGVRKNESDKGI
jgi:hypothetical protein